MMRPQTPQLTWPKLAKIIAFLTIIFFIVITTICFYKYFTWQYNGFDLAIFNQVFYNTSIGQFFRSTIQPPSYLGDHLEIIILLLLPFYIIYRSALTLLILQALIMAAAVIPLYFLAKKYLNPSLTLILVCLYLFNPITWNLCLYEFHILTLAPFFIFWAFYFYDNNKFLAFCASSMLCLLVREDVSFVILAFGLLALIERKKLKWIIAPIISSVTYFYCATQITAIFSSAGHYKFLIYYQWLGNNFQEIAINFFLKFPLVISHLTQHLDYNLEFILSPFLVFLFLPLLRPKYLLLCFGMFCQLILGVASAQVVLKMQYGSIFLAAFSLAAIFSLKYLLEHKRLQTFWPTYGSVVYICLGLGIVYNFIILGPALPLVKNIRTLNLNQVEQKNALAENISNNASVLTSYNLLANLSGRENIYALNYAFTGSQQYGLNPYLVPDTTEYLAFDFNDLATWHLQFKQKLPATYYNGDNLLRQIIADKNFKLKKVQNNLALWQKDNQPERLKLYEFFDYQPVISHQQKQEISTAFNFLGWDKNNNQLSLYFQVKETMTENYFLKIANDYLSLGYGLYPTSEWQPGQIIAMHLYNYAIGDLQIINLNGGFEMNGLGSVTNVYDKIDVLANIVLQN